MAARALLNTVRRAQLHSTTVRANSTAVSTTFTPLVAYVDGVPAEQVREITPDEKLWTFWSTSDYHKTQSSFLLQVVPENEQWVTSSGSVLKPGYKFLIPGLQSVKAVRGVDGATIGVLARGARASDGQVDAYAVLYTTYSDVAKTVAGDGARDGEMLLANAASKALGEAMSGVSASSGLSIADKSKLKETLLSTLSSTASQYGLKITDIDIRSAWPSSLDVPSKLVALEPLPKAEWDNTHGLKPDYWSDKIAPSFFTKFKYGNAREPEVVATPSIEWNLPSPPEVHHFHAQVPKMTVSMEDAGGAVKPAH